jgi:hypothetical protein
MVGRPLTYRAVTSAICQWSAQGAFRDMPMVGPRSFPRYATAGRFWRIFFYAVRDMPTVAQTVARGAKNRQRIRCRVVAKSGGSEDPVLTSMGALLYGFLNEKRVRSISLGLNYCSMGSSWPRSRDTVP